MKNIPKEVVQIADKIGRSVPETAELIRKVMQRDILTLGIDQRLSGSFNDPMTMRPERDTPIDWRQVYEKAVQSKDANDISSALSTMRDRRIQLSYENPKHREALKLLGDEGAEVAHLMEWAKSRPDKLERAQESGWHKLREFLQTTDHADARRARRDLDGEPQVFLVQHDWAKAFDGSKDFDGGEFRLPYEFCAFEFRVSGRRIIVPCRQVEDAVMARICVQYGEWWTITEQGDMTVGISDIMKDELAHLNVLVQNNVKAICVALEAEVATAEIVRAPHRLNAQRERSGRPVISDHHVINLARRYRPSLLPDDLRGTQAHGGKKRLHFRRGHWRHYETHKSWIRWMLVGDPDLGFIDKHYRA